MKLIIDNHEYLARPGESLYDMVRALGLDSKKLSLDPLAAKISGRVFTLNYIPLREKDVGLERTTIRKAMAASGGVVRLLRYSDEEGRETYVRTAQFVLFLAIAKLWPEAKAKMSYTVGSGIYFKISGAEDFSVDLLKEKMQSIIDSALVLHRRRISTKDAIAHYESCGLDDKARLLRYRPRSTFDIYERKNGIPTLIPKT